jgi:small subunit ribosomal protein S16
MLTIRMQRTGRKGFATFRVVVQDSRFSPTSGRVVANIGHYNPHTKETVIDKEKAEKYLKDGAQPSPRVIRLLKSEKVNLPEWVKISSDDKTRKTRNPEKLRKDQPKEEIAEVVSEEIIAEEIKEEIAEINDEIVAEEIAEVLVAEEEVEIAEEVSEIVELEAEKIVASEEKTVEA